MEYEYGNEEHTQLIDDGPEDIDMEMEMGNQEMSIDRKLQLAERANEIYREQVKYLQDHLNNIRALVQDKESIIENLMLRYDLGILMQDSSRAMEHITSDKIEDKELRRKAEALAQRTILENFELRELVNELRDENFHLRNEIYDLQDRLNRQALHISKMTKNAPIQAAQFIVQGNFAGNDFPIMSGSPTDPILEEAQRKHEQRAAKHNRRESSLAQPDLFNQNVEEETETDEETKPKQANGKNSKTQNEEPPAPEQTQPNIPPNNDRPNKRRGSKVLVIEDLKNSEEAKAKRQERQEKAHNRQDSAAVPNAIFESNHANTEEAKKIREERAKKIRKESLALPKNFLSNEDPNDSEDEASRKKRIKHQRKQSLMKAVRGKGHLSDEDTDKPQQVDFDTRKKLTIEKTGRSKDKETVIIEKPTIPHHRRDSSMPMPDLKFEDPQVLLAMSQDEVKGLKEKLSKIEQEKKVTEKQLQDNKQEIEQMERKLGQQLEKRLEEKFQKEKNGLLANNKKDMEQMIVRIEDLKNQLNQAANSKVNLIQCTNNEINRLNRVINTLLLSDKCKEITRLVLEDSEKFSK